MAKRHNEYSKLLGTAENDIRPLTEQASNYSESGMTDTMDALPMTGVPDLGDVASELKDMAHRLHHHAHHLEGMANMQPDFNENVGEPSSLQDIQFSGAFDSLPGGAY